VKDHNSEDCEICQRDLFVVEVARKVKNKVKEELREEVGDIVGSE
jgi:hypothetical protein